MSKIPGYTSVTEFAAKFQLDKYTVYQHLRQGYCSYPFKRKSFNKSQHPLFIIYNGMIQRCYNRKNTNYPRYGARGVTVCELWRTNFFEFVKDMGDRPNRSYSLDRIDNNKGYSKENCRWVSRSTQAQNTRQFKNHISYCNGSYVGRVHICGKRISTPASTSYEQVVVYLNELKQLYKDFIG